MNIINEIGEKDRTIEDLKKDYPIEIEKLEEVSLNYFGENDPKLLKTEILDKWKYLTKKLAYPYENFNSIDDYQKPADVLKKEDFFRKLKNDYPGDKGKEKTTEIIRLFSIKNGEKLTEIFLKGDVLLLTCVFEKFLKVSVNEFAINLLYCVSLPGSTSQCGLKYTGIIYKHIKIKI